MMYRDLQALVPVPGKNPDFHACLEAFPALEFARTTPQDPRHHGEGDVWSHTMMVVEALLMLPVYSQLTRIEQEIVFFAALLHDIAKYSTTVINPETGVIGQPGHSRKGAIDARIALWDAGVPFAVREAVCRLIHAHQIPFFAVDGSRRGSPEFLVRLLSWQLSIPLLSILAEADMRGRICEDKQRILDNIELFREQAREEDCYGKPRAFADVHTAISYFRGADIHPDYSFYQEEGAKVIVMSGLPASGKNTWIAENRPDLPVVSFDDAREELGLRHGKNEGTVAHLVIDRAKMLLRQKRPFIWNATNLSELMRKKTLDLLFAYHAEVELIYLEKSRSELLHRNAKRDSSLSNKVLEGMLYRWDLPLPTEAHSVCYIYA